MLDGSTNAEMKVGGTYSTVAAALPAVRIAPAEPSECTASALQPTPLPVEETSVFYDAQAAADDETFRTAQFSVTGPALGTCKTFVSAIGPAQCNNVIYYFY